MSAQLDIDAVATCDRVIADDRSVGAVSNHRVIAGHREVETFSKVGVIARDGDVGGIPDKVVVARDREPIATTDRIIVTNERGASAHIGQRRVHDMHVLELVNDRTDQSTIPWTTTTSPTAPIANAR